MKPFSTYHGKIFTCFLFCISLILIPGVSRACDIGITVYGDQKEDYQSGDEVILKVSIFLPHKNCDVLIDDTKFMTEGLTVIGATKWSLNSSGLYERLVKVKINNNENNKSILHVQRVCEKEGGYGAFTLLTSP